MPTPENSAADPTASVLEDECAHSSPYDPNDEATLTLMRDAGTDRAYIALTRLQSCFRARLTPKPWRIGLPTPRLRFPEATATEAAEQRAWEDRYEAACANWATCHFIERVGRDVVHPDIRPVLEYHDAACRVLTDLPLA